MFPHPCIPALKHLCALLLGKNLTAQTRSLKTTEEGRTMIKRQFYSLEHRSRDNGASSGSSTSSSSAHDGAASSSAEDEPTSPALEQQEDEVSSPVISAADEDRDRNKTSNHDLATGEPVFQNLDNKNNDDVYPKTKQKKKQKSPKSDLSNQWADLVAETLNEEASDFADECVVSCKKVLKCRLCPKTICLSRDSMQAHLVSKKHARSLKLMSEGRLKVMLNSDGEEEEQGETHAERHARILASFEKEAAKHTLKRKKPSGRQRQRRRTKKKAKKSGNG
ncbi:hypothetical protein GOP47_0025633 [Adiantum capillus-veneris]|uniref:Uncharacterized protein n=1 Tax=Adiantum capillus-veneris TaxID=13818 RepID=A0A9D4U0P4_ADICA|nr:hypothetical protein GOP47_0025633 [Adiantum capillus-veneris]